MFIDLTNQTYGKWKVIKLSGRTPAKKALWLCECECKRTANVAGGDLRSGKSTKCRACGLKGINTRHGLGHTRFNTIYYDMVRRTSSPKSVYFDNYGGRGISCLWKSFEDFMVDMYESYKKRCEEVGEKNVTIDRIDNNGNYCKENCRWSTRKEQARNKSNNHYLVLDGESKTIAEWSEILGMDYDTLRDRVVKLGWSHEMALTT